MKYADFLPVLLKKNLVQILAPPRVPNPLPPWYRPDQNCVFHQGAPGHDTEQCYPLKEEVQKLIENNILVLRRPRCESATPTAVSVFSFRCRC